MKQTILLFLMTTFLLIGCAGGEAAQAQQETTPSEANTEEPVASESQADPITSIPSRVVQADGQLVAIMPAVNLSFETNGRLLTLNVQAGDEIQAGDLIATLEDTALQDAVTSAQLQVATSENNLAQAQLSLDNLLNWTPDETAVALAEANLIAAQTALTNTQSQINSAGSNLTSANVGINQAQRQLEDARKAYNTAHDPGRDWELGDPWHADALKAEREGTARAVLNAEEALSVARSQWSVTASALIGDSALTSAEASVVSAQQALEQALKGPKESEIAGAILQVENAQIALDQSLFALQQAENGLTKTQLVAPFSGTIITTDLMLDALVSTGQTVVTLLDVSQLEFHTSNLSERDLAQIYSGQVAQVSFKTYSDLPFTGNVVRIVPQSSGIVGNDATFTVVIQLDPTDKTLFPGMTGRVEISNEE